MSRGPAPTTPRAKPRTYVYIDGYNLYYGCLEKQPYKWLNLDTFCHVLLPKNDILRINYYTARIAATPPYANNPAVRQKMARQETYLRALRTLPSVHITYGRFQSTRATALLATPPARGSASVQIIKNEEKGSDVNIGAHLVRDACGNAYDVAVLISNDSDLAEPLRIIRADFGKVVGLLPPVLNPNRHISIELRHQADFMREIRASSLARSQFPPILADEIGAFSKPATW